MPSRLLLICFFSSLLFATTAEKRAALEAQIASAPQNVAARLELCKLLTLCEEYKEAIKHGKAAAEADPANAEASYLYAVALRCSMKSNPIAWMSNGNTYLTLLHQAIALKPDYEAAYKELAAYYLNAPAIAGGSREKAIATAESLIKNDRKAGLLLSAEIAAAKGHLPEGLERNEKILNEFPNDARVLKQKGNLLIDLERYREAIHALQASLAQNANQEETHYLLGIARLKSATQLELALQDFDIYLSTQAPESAKNRARALWRKGQVQVALGAKAQARAAFEQSLKLNPENADCKKELAAL